MFVVGEALTLRLLARHYCAVVGVSPTTKRITIMAENKINRQALLIEFISVVFAVLLALFLNSWRESSNMEANLVKVKQTIKHEILRNDSLVRESYAYRRKMIQSFYAGNHLIMGVALQSLPINVEKDQSLAELFHNSLVFSQKQYEENVKVLRNDGERVLVMGDNVFDIVIENDSLKLYGIGNIRLKTPSLSNRSWDIAQVTGTIVKMDIALVEQLSKMNSLVENYAKTSDKALDMIYAGSQQGLLSVFEDMNYLEGEIIAANTVLLKLLGE